MVSLYIGAFRLHKGPFNCVAFLYFQVLWLKRSLLGYFDLVLLALFRFNLLFIFAVSLLFSILLTLIYGRNAIYNLNFFIIDIAFTTNRDILSVSDDLRLCFLDLWP